LIQNLFEDYLFTIIVRRVKDVSDGQIQFLKAELDKRLQKNPHYSMRAFAQSLGLNIGTLSGLLSGKRPLTPKTAIKLCQRLGVSPVETEAILKVVQKQKPLVLRGEVPRRLELDEESFRAISDWQHYAILQLVRTREYTKEKGVKWFAKQLRITELGAKLAIERMLKLGLLFDDDGVLKRTNDRLTTANKDLTSAALKKLQKQIREKAIYSLEHDPVHHRSMTSMTMAINPSKLQLAKTLIDEFQEKLCDLLEQDEKEKVYQLEIGLFPLQVLEN
jgi:uncharacterized protein (TIGR02147 family)